MPAWSWYQLLHPTQTVPGSASRMRSTNCVGRRVGRHDRRRRARAPCRARAGSRSISLDQPDRDRHVVHRAERPIEHEQVGEARQRDPAVGEYAVLPQLVDGEPVQPRDLHRAHIGVRVEAGGVDQDIELVLGAVRHHEALGDDLRDLALFDPDVGLLHGLVVVAVGLRDTGAAQMVVGRSAFSAAPGRAPTGGTRRTSFPSARGAGQVRAASCRRPGSRSTAPSARGRRRRACAASCARARWCAGCRGSTPTGRGG